MAGKFAVRSAIACGVRSGGYGGTEVTEEAVVANALAMYLGGGGAGGCIEDLPYFTAVPIDCGVCGSDGELTCTKLSDPVAIGGGVVAFA